MTEGKSGGADAAGSGGNDSGLSPVAEAAVRKLDQAAQKVDSVMDETAQKAEGESAEASAWRAIRSELRTLREEIRDVQARSQVAAYRVRDLEE